MAAVGNHFRNHVSSLGIIHFATAGERVNYVHRQVAHEGFNLGSRVIDEVKMDSTSFPWIANQRLTLDLWLAKDASYVSSRHYIIIIKVMKIRYR